MTESELRAAAETIREAEEPTFHNIGCVKHISVREHLAAWTLAKAWLAEHPADDAEPVTAEWLASVGITEDEGWPNGDIYVCAWVGRRVEILIGERWNQTYIPDGMAPQTRGPFRRLCAALGVPLKESE